MSGTGNDILWKWMVAVGLDCVGVALVVPLLPYYYKEFGVDAKSFGGIGSVYNIAQIVGGVVLGLLADSKLGRRRIFLASLAGTGISYALVALAKDLNVLVLSRVLVGLVKQTFTVANGVLTARSSEQERAAVMGRLSAVSRVCWIAGQALGGFLSSRIGMRAPAFLAAGIFLADFCFVYAAIPEAADGRRGRRRSGTPAERGGAAQDSERTAKDGAPRPTGRPRSAPSFVHGLRSGASRALAPVTALLKESKPMLLAVLLVRLLHYFVRSAVRSMGAFYAQERFGIGPEWAGYASAIRGVLDVGLQGLLVGRVTKLMGEKGALILALVLTAALTLTELSAALVDKWVYSLFLSPAYTVLGGLASTCMSSLYSQAVPSDSASSSFGAFDVLRSATGVLAPLYGGYLLSFCGAELQPLMLSVHLALIALLIAAVLPGAATSAERRRAKAKVQ